MTALTTADILLRAGGAEFARSGRLVRRSSGLWLPGGDTDPYTFVRADGATPLATAIDRYGAPRLIPQNEPRIDWTGGLPALLMEHGDQNSIANPETITGGGGWTLAGGTLAGAAAYSLLGCVSFTRLTAINTGVAFRVPTFPWSDGTHGFTCLLRFDGVAGKTHHGIFDNTASAWRALAEVTWAADGSATAVAVNGVLVAFELLVAGTYRLAMQVTGYVSANVNRAYASDSGGTTATSIQVSAMCLNDGAVPSTYQSGNANPARVTEAGGLKVPTAFGPQDMTAYVRLARPWWADIASDFSALGYGHFYCFEILAAGATPIFNLLGLNTARTWSANFCGNTVTASVPAGATLEVIAQAKNVTTAPAVAIDVGAGLGAFSSTGFNPTSAGWSDRNPALGVGCTALGGTGIFHGRLYSLVIAKGLHTMAEMRAGS